MQLTESAAERYKDLIAMLTSASRADLSRASLQQVVEQANGNVNKVLSERIAANTSLTVNEVEPSVKSALAVLPQNANSAEKAAAAKQVADDLIPGISVELSEAVMLNGAVRTVFAAVFTLIFVGGIFAVIGVGTESHPSETTLIALIVATVLAVFMSLVLIMGYKKVNAKLEPTGAS